MLQNESVKKDKALKKAHGTSLKTEIETKQM